MKKLRLELEHLQVTTFEPAPGHDRKGTAHGYDGTDCSKQFTCGIASREPKEGDDRFPPRTSWCCV
jgi:hypothetical protein